MDESVNQAKSEAEEALKGKATAEEKAEKDAESSFMDDFKKAVADAVDAMADEYMKKRLSKRQAGGASFLGNASEKGEGGKTFTQLDLNKTMCFSEADKFNDFCAKLGFATDAYDKIVEK